MSRQAALARAAAHFDSGEFVRVLATRVACPSESQNPARAGELRTYLDTHIAPALAAMGFTSRVVANPVPGAGPMLIAQRIEDAALPTVLMYGHGDVVRGQEGEWPDGIAPWAVTARGERLYGRGTADNKGQHSINLPRWRRCWPSATGASASTSSGCSRWARRPARPAWPICARASMRRWRPMC